MHIVTSYDGLFEFDETTGKFNLLLGIGCFGICRYLDRFFISISSRPISSHHPCIVHTDATLYSQFGSIMSFRYEKSDGPDSIKDVRIEVPTGLDQSVHGLVVNNNVLYAIETHTQRIRAYDMDSNTGRCIINASLFDIHLSHRIPSVMSKVNIIDRPHINLNAESTLSPRTYYPFGSNALSPEFKYLDKERKIYNESYRHINAIASTINCSLLILNSYVSDWDINNKLKSVPTVSILTLSTDNNLINSGNIMIPGAKQNRSSDIYHDLVKDPLLPDRNVFLIVCNDNTINRIDVDNAGESFETIVLSETEYQSDDTSRVRGLSFDGKKYVVAINGTIQVIDNETKNIVSYRTPCVPCAIIKV